MAEAVVVGWRGFPVDPKRAARATGMSVTPEPDGSYVVRSVYRVQLDDPTLPACDCGDHAWRDGLCKHAIAALDYERTRGAA